MQHTSVLSVSHRKYKVGATRSLLEITVGDGRIPHQIESKAGVEPGANKRIVVGYYDMKSII